MNHCRLYALLVSLASVTFKCTFFIGKLKNVLDEDLRLRANTMLREFAYLTRPE